MSIFSFLRAPACDDKCFSVTFDWNGKTIDFSTWAGDAYGIFDYQTRDGYFDFQFELKPVSNEVRIFILKQPPYGGRPDDGHSTHRYGLEANRPYICITLAAAPTNVPDALSWLVYWAEQTAQYIRTGRTFS